MTEAMTRECPLADVLAERLRDSRRDLAARWLDRISARVSLDANKIFPSNELLDHVPLLIQGVADYLQDPVNEVSADMPVVAKAMELGALRHAQGFDVYEILKEYEILGGILFTFLAEAADGIPQPCAKSELLHCGQRLFKAVTLIQQTTTTHFLRLGDTRIAEREDRLRAFNQTVSHEIKNRIGAILGAGGALLEMPDLPPEKQKQFLEIVVKNARTMRHSIENLIALSTTERDSRQHRHIQLPEAAREAVREVRESAKDAGLEIRVGDLPNMEINAAAVELCLANYLSNAIKYSDPAKPDRFAEITGTVETGRKGERELVIRVRDNGHGVPPEMRDRLFQRFFRANEGSDVEGTGLGLSIVADTVESLGGRAWAEFPGDETVFAFSLPFRRSDTDLVATDGKSATEESARSPAIGQG